MTDNDILDVARTVTQADETEVFHIFGVLEKHYRATGRYGLCVMLYAVAYSQGLRAAYGDVEGVYATAASLAGDHGDSCPAHCVNIASDCTAADLDLFGQLRRGHAVFLKKYG